MAGATKSPSFPRPCRVALMQAAFYFLPGPILHWCWPIALPLDGLDLEMCADQGKDQALQILHIQQNPHDQKLQLEAGCWTDVIFSSLQRRNSKPFQNKNSPQPQDSCYSSINSRSNAPHRELAANCSGNNETDPANDIILLFFFLFN